MKTVACTLASFPTLTETFILGEIADLRRRGLSLELFAPVRSKDEACRPEARLIAEEMTYVARLLSGLGANLAWVNTGILAQIFPTELAAAAGDPVEPMLESTGTVRARSGF